MEFRPVGGSPVRKSRGAGGREETWGNFSVRILIIINFV